MMGKKTIRAAMKTLGMRPKPNQMVSSGAMATMGVTFTRIARGKRPRSRNLDCAMRVARRMAMVPPRAKPSSAPSSVFRPSRANMSGSW
jgi:hypothetical protein